MSNVPQSAAGGPADPSPLAAALRSTIGTLVRATRGIDQLAPIPAAVLDLLDRHGPMTTAELAVGRGVRHQTMAATVKELVDAGYLAARPDPADARKKILDLTPEGGNAINTDRRGRVALLAHALAETLDDEERHVVAEALSLIDRVTASITATRTEPGFHGETTITGAW
jgi:DNA-binding MarR family transcriptional regulator